ncbi:MAG: hypothetical protein Q8K98_10480 [Bacteroidota bacterium]|nr:hypothetical protein [Bacteroidota bacterium]
MITIKYIRNTKRHFVYQADERLKHKCPPAGDTSLIRPTLCVIALRPNNNTKAQL